MLLSESEILGFVETSDAYIGIFNADGFLLKGNPKWADFFNCAPEKVIGKSLFDQMLISDKGDFITQYQAITEKQGIHTFKIYTDNPNQGLTAYHLIVNHREDNYYVIARDISESQRSTATLEVMSQFVSTGAWYHDPLQNKSVWSDQCYRIFGIEPGTHVTESLLLNRFDPDYRDLLKQHISQLYSSNKAYDFTGKIRAATGEDKWVRVLANPVIYNGKLININGLCADVTSSHKLARDLKESTDTLGLALKGIKSTVFDHNLETDTTKYSEDFKKLLGLDFEKEEFPEEEFRTFIHPEDREEAYQQHLQQLTRSDNFYFNQYRLIQNNGEVRYYEVHGWRQKNRLGETLRIIGNLIDVHDKKLAKEEADLKMRQLNTMLNNGALYISLLDTDGNILHTDDKSNEFYISEFGLDAKTDTVKYVDICPNNLRDEFLSDFFKAIKGERISKYITRPMAAGGNRYVKVDYRPIFSKDGEVMQVLMQLQDFSDFKAAELAREEARRKSLELDQFKQGILANLNHEIRTPLNAFGNITKLLMEGASKDQMELLEVQEASAERLLNTINQLTALDELSEIDTLTIAPIALSLMVNSVVDQQLHVASKNNTNVKVEVAQDLAVLANEKLLAAALSNLINNAFKYTVDGSVSIVASVLEDQVSLSVEDTGKGIAEENLETIFIPFNQESIGLDRDYEGTGIGLSLTQKYTELIGGHLTVSSQVGRGSIFTMKLKSA